MTEYQLLDELKELLGQLKIDVRKVGGEVSGGLCRIGDRNILLCNPALSAGQRVALLCRELNRLDLSKVFILPAVRLRIRRARETTVTRC